jgi:hypothetical protein
MPLHLVVEARETTGSASLRGASSFPSCRVLQAVSERSRPWRSSHSWPQSSVAVAGPRRPKS